MKINKLSSLVIEHNRPFVPLNQVVALGLSGGVDSVALFYVFLELSKKNIFQNFIVLHVNFGLRGEESDQDQRFCEDLARSHGIECHVLSGLEAAPAGESVQTWARRVRHEWFLEFARKGYVVALAHQANDVAENVLFRMARGSSPEHLAGMSQLDGHLWRPFLKIPRTDIVEAMGQARLTWREDSSNETTKYTRNRLRHEVLPVLEEISPGATMKIAQLAEALAENASSLESIAELGAAKSLASVNQSRKKIKGIVSFFKEARFGQVLDLGRGFRLLRAPFDGSSQRMIESGRALQHRPGLLGRSVAAVVSPGTGIFLPKPAGFSYKKSAYQGYYQFLLPVLAGADEIFVRLPKSEDKVTFAESTSAFKFKDLMQKWKVVGSERICFVTVETGKSERVPMLVDLFKTENEQ